MSQEWVDQCAATIRSLLQQNAPMSAILVPLIALAMTYKLGDSADTADLRRRIIFTRAKTTDDAYALAIACWTHIFPTYKDWVLEVAEVLPSSIYEFERLYDSHACVRLLLNNDEPGFVRHIAAKRQESLIKDASDDLDVRILLEMSRFSGLFFFWGFALNR